MSEESFMMAEVYSPDCTILIEIDQIACPGCLVAGVDAH